jgi:two-component system sensor histidine kinase AlgZ
LAAEREPEPREAQAFLPDFCATATVFVVVLVAALVAILITLAGYDRPGEFLIDLAKNSLFILWLALLSAVVMCIFRERLESSGKTLAFVISFIVLEILCVTLAEAAYQLTRVFGGSIIIQDSHAGFLLRTFAISSIVIALAMRYLYVSSEWRRSILLEAEARISALQALIRPHFLFNSMNTIAALTRSDPRQAEEAVEDLSDLLRANLRSSSNRTTLENELQMAAIYERIEKLRLGDRLDVRRDLADLPMRALIPSLTIQPLLENAIHHGIELLPDGGAVLLSGRRAGRNLEISISNPRAPGAARSGEGNKMALANIRQRFELAYEGRASVDIDETPSSYTVTLSFPHEEASA